MSEQPVIYLDNAATTFPKPEPVYQAMDQFYRQYGGNAGRGANPLARKAATLVEETRGLATSWLGAGEVVFLPSATYALNTVILGAGLRAGDRVYLTPFEHNSVLRPVEHLRKTLGIQVHVIPFNRTTMACELDKLAVEFQLEPPTMLCLTQVSNVFGLVLPVEAIIRLARKANPHVIVLVDGAQAAGLLPLPMSEIDALVFSGHKSLYGPYGVAGIAFNGVWRPAPTVFGGTGTQSESLDMPEHGPARYEAGSQNIVAMAGLNAAVKWLYETGRDAIVEHGYEMTRLLQDELSKLPGLIVYLPADRSQQFSIVSFNVEGVAPQVVETALGAQGIAVRAGLHCAPESHRHMDTGNLAGTVRVSLPYISQSSSIQRLLILLLAIIEDIHGGSRHPKRAR